MKNYIILFALLIIPQFCWTQITLTVDDVPVIGDVFVNYVDTLPDASIQPGMAGPDQIWDFTSLEIQDSLLQAAIDPANAFGGESFPTATLALTTSNTVSAQFAQLTPSELLGIGIVLSNPLGGEPLVVELDPPQTVAKIPTFYEDNYVDNWGFVIGLPSFIQGVDSLRATNNVTTHIDIDAWGTMQLPAGEFDVLRRRDSSITQNVLEGLVGIFWVPVQNETTTTVTYNFISKETKGNLVTMTLDQTTGEVDNVNWVNISNEVAILPEANFSYQMLGPASDRAFDFTDLSTNEPDGWVWDFGDGNVSAEQHPFHQYAENGTYSVCLTASNLAGIDTHCEDITIDVEEAPMAAFTYTNMVTGEYEFTDQSTNNPLSWSWDLGDGTTSILQNPQHTYTMDGDYEVCLVATNNAGSDETCQMISVSILLAPVADFSTSLIEYNEVQFNDLSTNEPTAWTWDFGDGQTSTLQNPIHIYAAEGDYNVCLTAENAAGADMTCENQAIIFPATNTPWEAHWALQPNPANDFVFLSLDEKQRGATIEIYSIVGRLMNSSIYQGSGELDISSLSPGTYVMKIVKDNNAVGINKLIKH